MKVYNLSASNTCPCIVIQFKTCTIMMDAALDLSSVYNFLPLSIIDNARLVNLPKCPLKDEHGDVISESEMKECNGKVFVDSCPEFCLPEMDLLNLSTVDVILISNSVTILALPYITEYCGFQGTVYATEPTKQIGRLLMEELVEYCQRIPKEEHAYHWKQDKYKSQLPTSLARCWERRLLSWRQCYSSGDLQSALSNVHAVGYAERVNIFGALNATAYSSGYSLGSCNWLIASDFEKVSYLSGSSTLTTHPQQLETTALADSDLVIFTGLTQAPTHNPDNMLAEFCACIAKTVKSSGNVLVPCLPSGLLYDLLECLLPYMEQQNLIQVPIYLISPSAKGTLAFAQIYAEWLHPNKQNKVYLPEEPFPHGELKDLGRLKVFSTIQDGLSSNFKQPCIVFAGHPSLRFGDAVHFVQLWGKSSANSIIFVEPNFPHLEALAPFQPISARAFHFPIDTRTNYQTTSQMINSLRPKRVLVPSTYLEPPVSAPHRTDLKLTTDCKPIALELNSVLKLNIKRRFEKVHLQPELASSLIPTEVTPGVLIAPISAQLSSNDNRHVLKAVHKRTGGGGRKRKFHDEIAHRPLMCGNLKLASFVNELKQDGFADVKVEDGPSGKIVLLQNTAIQLEDGFTHIVCDGGETLRTKLRDVALRNLHAP